MRSANSSIGRELLWFLAWLAIFVVITWALLRFLVPHHFNDRIAVLLAAIATSLVWIGLRGYAARRA
ncbi:MAG TPA: hypothetical protein VFE17_00295 [Candidatus Baltobacteraceae bacterium]|nr:hypothetical protein [Candidatus Baltobacteraceae bacterium]